MILSKAMTRFGLVAAAAALVLGLGLASAGTALAAGEVAAIYGAGFTPGQNMSVNESGGAISFTANGRTILGERRGGLETGVTGLTFGVEAASFGTTSGIANGYKLTVSQIGTTATISRLDELRTVGTTDGSSTTTADINKVDLGSGNARHNAAVGVTNGHGTVVLPQAAIQPTTGNAGLVGVRTLLALGFLSVITAASALATVAINRFGIRLGVHPKPLASGLALSGA